MTIPGLGSDGSGDNGASTLTDAVQLPIPNPPLTSAADIELLSMGNCHIAVNNLTGMVAAMLHAITAESVQTISLRTRCPNN